MRTKIATIGLMCLLAVGCDRAQTEAQADPTPTASVAASPARPIEPPPHAARPQPAPTPTPPQPTVDPTPTLADAQPVLEIPEVPQAPEDYGLIQPPLPVPAPEELVVHALAGYEVVAVHARPDGDSSRLGYLRLGTRLMVTAKAGTDGCAKGWYGLPTGGFACASKGLVVDAKRPPYMQRAPAAARLDEPFPYDYAYVKRWNSPMWWRIPSADELGIVAEQRVIREAKREGKPLPANPAAPAKPAAAAEPPKAAAADPKPADAGAPKLAKADSLPSVTDDPAEVVAKADAAAKADTAAKADAAAKTDTAAKADSPPKAPAAVAKTTPTPAEPVAEPPPPVKLPFNPETPWLEKGFFVSLGEKVRDEGKTWWHTARGAYVDTAHAYKYDAKDFSGVELGPDSGFPFGYAMVKAAKVHELLPDGTLKVTGVLERRTFVDLTEEIEVGGKSYMMTVDGSLLRKKDLRMAQPQPVPEGIEPWERWVDVSLAKQILVAYEGDHPVYVTLVSTGREGTEEEPFDTPPGRYRIRSKHVSSTMDGPTLNEGNYSIQDVPWAMYFEGSYALHGAFWHNSFGRVRSHGCVNLGPTDARWLFMWTTPFLPEGWHGVHAHEGSPGTTVVVRE